MIELGSSKAAVVCTGWLINHCIVQQWFLLTSFSTNFSLSLVKVLKGTLTLLEKVQMFVLKSVFHG